MELLQLQYFKELAHSQHLTNTANRLMVSPSAISTSIARLENELGIKLFDRVGRNIILNASGKLYLTHVEKALSSLEEGKNLLNKAAEVSAKTLNVAMWNSIVYNNMVKDFRAAFPDVIFKFVFYDPILLSPSTLQALDFFISPLHAFQHPDWDCEIFFEDKIMLAVSPNHPLAQREEVSVPELASEAFIFPTQGSWAMYNHQLCERAGFVPRIRMECSTSLRPSIVVEENAVCFTTLTAVKSGIYDCCKILRVLPPFSERPQAIFWHRDQELRPIALAFKSFVMNYF